MGVVYKATQLSLGRPVAMKVLPRHMTSDLAFIKRFENEARAIAKLNHPNIVQIFDIGRQGDIIFYTMEIIEGPALDEVLYKEGFLSTERTLAIITQVSQALQYAHGKGIVHRDIKPSNIMTTKSGSIKVTDFGLALQQRTTRLTVEGGIVGTPEYMSPEQAAGRTATARSDIYSLGIVAYELLTGKVPFEGDSSLMVLNKIQNAEPQWPRSINPDIPVGLENMIRSMMAKNAADRYANCQEIIQDAQRVRSQQPVSARKSRPATARLLGMGAAALGLLGVIALGTVLTLRLQNDQPALPEPSPVMQQEPEPAIMQPATAEPVVEIQNPRLLFPPMTLGDPGEIHLALAALEDALENLKRRSPLDDQTLLLEDFAAFRERLAQIENRMADFQDAMYSDRLILKRGDSIRGRIEGESLDKVRFIMPLGLQLIPRDRIALTVYSTADEGALSEELLRVGEKLNKLKRAFVSSQRALEPFEEDISEMPEEPAAEEAVADESVPMSGEAPEAQADQEETALLELDEDGEGGGQEPVDDLAEPAKEMLEESQEDLQEELEEPGAEDL
jgi:hypothetical protein